MPKQVFDFCDYLGPLASAAVFALVLLVFSFFVLNLCLVRKSDEVTCFERFGYKHNVRLGPHSLGSIKNRRQKKYANGEEEEKPTTSARDGASRTQIIPHVQIDAASSS